MKRYSMGIDFGTLSCRGVIVDIDTGEEIASAVSEYSHGVISDIFIDGSRLPDDFALQHPADYLDSLFYVTSKCITESGVSPKDIIGVGVDFTACTMIPVTEDMTPLCFLDGFKSRPHAYAKLWKHHGAQREADIINELATRRGESWLKQYGGTVSCEWLLPKILEILHKDKEVYQRSARFIDAGDWIVSLLVGGEVHSVCQAGFKALYSDVGYPDEGFLTALDPDLGGLIGGKVCRRVDPISADVGGVCAQLARKTGLAEGTRVSVPVIDAHAALPALGVTDPGALLMILGTSSCHILLGDKPISIPGTCGYVNGGIYDGAYAYEAGQSAVGDSFDWFVKNCVPESYYRRAAEGSVGIHKYLREKASRIPAGSGGVLVLDWWNGNRTPYVDGNLSGAIIGLTLGTKPEQIYRAMIEATAFGTRRIVELYENNGIQINQIFASGGIALKDPLLMQIYADVLGRQIKVPQVSQSCAFGSAVLGAVGPLGYKNAQEASAVMKKSDGAVYSPDLESKNRYDGIYEKYCRLSEYFAKDNTAIMNFLKECRGENE